MSNTPLNLAVIIGSVREGRFGPTVAKWFAEEARKHEGFDVNVIDLAEYDFPADMSLNDSVSKFSSLIDAADAIVVVTQEYNHSYGGYLKLAIDALKPEWRGKPVGFVAYGGLSGGLRAVEALRIVFAEVHSVTVRETVALPLCRQNWGENGPKDVEGTSTAVKALLNNLEWWGVALRDMRNRVPYGEPVKAAVAAD